jgi:phage tail-like protein
MLDPSLLRNIPVRAADVAVARGAALLGSPDAATQAPIGLFNFHVSFSRDAVDAAGSTEDVALCKGAFSEVNGLEATMEPRAIREGGHHWGAHQRPGPVSFATVVFKRGITPARDLWWWFELMGSGSFAARLRAQVQILDAAGAPVMAWTLRRALPVKFKCADLNARASDVGVEELHVVHEGLEHSA